jgi:hypothetical protein
MVNRTCKPVDRCSGFPANGDAAPYRAKEEGSRSLRRASMTESNGRTLVGQIPPNMQIYDLFLVFLARFLAAANSEGLAAGVQAQIRSAAAHFGSSTICFKTHWHLLPVVIYRCIYLQWQAPSFTSYPVLEAMTPKKTTSIVVLLFLAFIYSSVYARGNSAAATTTELTISSGSVDIGMPATLTATVLLGSMPVRHGSVVFCDANASRCQGLAILGSAQLTGSGTAVTRLTLGAGTYSIKAVFRGTPRSVPPLSGSASPPQAFTVNVGAKIHP